MKTPRLADLVLESLREAFPEDQVRIGSTSLSTKKGSNSYDIYINHIFIVEVTDHNVYMWIPMTHHDPRTVPEKVSYSAADPKFFQHLVGTAKLIIQRFQDDADIGLHNAKLFGLDNN